MLNALLDDHDFLVRELLLAALFVHFCTFDLEINLLDSLTSAIVENYLKSLFQQRSAYYKDKLSFDDVKILIC